MEMIKLQEIISAKLVESRQESLKDSPQMLLGELIARLEGVADKTKKVLFDSGHCATTLDSWRGSYAELALGYSMFEDNAKTVQELLDDCKNAVGATFEGYKGGDFKMGKNTPIWVANWSEHGCDFLKHSGNTVGITGLAEAEHTVTLITKAIEY